MNILVTGGTGFLGRYIVDFLEKEGNDVFITTRNPKNEKQIFADFQQNILDLSLFASDLQKKSITISYVIHAAGKAHMIPKTEIEKKAFFDINVGGTKLLLEKLESLSEKPQSFIFISSVSVYGLETGIEIDEDHQLGSKDPYGLSKIESEKLILDWGKKNGVRIGIIRLPLIWGKNAPGNLSSMINGIKTGKYFRIGNGSARKSMVWAGDVASIIPKIEAIGGIYNLTDGIHPDFSEIDTAITKALKLKPVKTLPYFIAKLAAIAGSTIERVTGKKLPFNDNLLQKITLPLTFADKKARLDLNWNPSSVLEHINELVL